VEQSYIKEIGIKMESKECDKCGKVIEGFTLKDLNYKMIMHSISHRDKSKDKIQEE
jgi:hypothetical protein